MTMHARYRNQQPRGLDMRMHIHIFESSQPEGLSVGGLVYKIHSNQEYVLLTIKGNFLNMIKGILKKHLCRHSRHDTQWQNTESATLKNKYQIRMLAFTATIQHHTGVLVKATRQEK